jgi:hypothetical protein
MSESMEGESWMLISTILHLRLSFQISPLLVFKGNLNTFSRSGEGQGEVFHAHSYPMSCSLL